MNSLLQLSNATSFSAKTQRRMGRIYSQVSEQRGLAGIMDMSLWLSKINALKLRYESIAVSNDGAYDRWVLLTYNVWEKLHTVSKVDVINWFDTWLSSHYDVWMIIQEHYPDETGVTVFSNWIELCTSILIHKIDESENPSQAVEDVLDWIDIQMQVQSSMVTVLDKQGMRYFGSWVKQHCRVWAFFMNGTKMPAKRFLAWGSYIWQMWCAIYLQSPKDSPKKVYDFLKENYLATRTMEPSEFLVWFDEKVIDYI